MVPASACTVSVSMARSHRWGMGGWEGIGMYRTLFCSYPGPSSEFLASCWLGPMLEDRWGGRGSPLGSRLSASFPLPPWPICDRTGLGRQALWINHSRRSPIVRSTFARSPSLLTCLVPDISFPSATTLGVREGASVGDAQASQTPEVSRTAPDRVSTPRVSRALAPFRKSKACCRGINHAGRGGP